MQPAPALKSANTITMTEKDKQLIQQAWQIPCTDWYKVEWLIQEADTMECKQRLDCIAKAKYHQEEHSIE